MQASLPTGPTGNAGIWTPDLRAPDADVSIPLAENPNPIAADTTLATLLTEGTEASFNSSVPDASTAVLLLNHSTADYAQYFDPKINDTLILNKNIKEMLLLRHPDIDPENIIGAFMGIKEDGTAEGYEGTERTRNMRGENLGHAWLYESSAGPETYAAHGVLPGDEWGYKYWDALEYLKNRDVEHIVICFPQIVADSVLNMVELPNQIAKEIGFKNWMNWGTGDDVSYPGVGHPFADYWGIWIDDERDDGKKFCFKMGGCPDNGTYADNGIYPPLRQTTGARDDLDPSLAYDVSEYGHLGYNPAVGAPNPDTPIQDQYTGTWAMYQPPNDDIRIAEMLADYVLDAAGCQDVPELEFDDDGNCLLSKDELKTMKEHYKVEHKQEKADLKASQVADKQFLKSQKDLLSKDELKAMKDHYKVAHKQEKADLKASQAADKKLMKDAKANYAE